MQETQKEIVFPLKLQRENGFTISRPWHLLLLLGATFFLTLGMSIAGFAFPHLQLLQSPSTSTSPTASLGFLTYPIAIICSIACLTIALMLPMAVRGLHTGPLQLRLNNEGILYAYPLPIFIRWDEITAFIPSKHGEYSLVYITVKDETAWINRFLETYSIKGWESSYYRFVTRINLWFVHTLAKNPSSIFLSQHVLPISIDQLLITIQEQFAMELQEHHIRVEKVQD